MSGDIQASLWPYPTSITKQTNVGKFNPSVTFTQNGQYSYDYFLNGTNTNNPLTDFKTYLSALVPNPDNTRSGLDINYIIEKDIADFVQPKNSTNYKEYERYTLKIDSTNTTVDVDIKANTYIGVGYALITLQQMCEPTSDDALQIRNLPLTITDSPNTYYRSTYFDTGRTFFSVETIINTIRKMAFNKLNYFDWHITDNQSWPLSVGPITTILAGQSIDPTFKDMYGAFSKHEIYTKANIQHIIETASNYGIQVNASIDQPGHCSSLMYGSVEATQKAVNEGIQVIRGWESIYQGFANAPETIIGYLDIETNDSDRLTKVVYLIYYILDEVLTAFKVGNNQPKNKNKYSTIIGLNFDEVSPTVISPESYQRYLNQLLNIFHTDTHDNIVNTIKVNEYLPLTNNKNIWTNQYLKIKFWIDPVVGLNLSTTKPYTYTDNFKLSRFKNRILLSLWKLWPDVSVNQNNTILGNIPGVEAINYNSNYFYMDSGFPGTNVSGFAFNYDSSSGDSPINQAISTYWISQVPNIEPVDWGKMPGGKGWKIGWGKIYNYNIHWDWDEDVNKNSYQTGPNSTSKLKNIVGGGIACWSETIYDGNLDSVLITNMCAFSEALWKFNPYHAPDNLNHARYRLYYHLKKLSKHPYNSVYTPIYSGETISKLFPQGCFIPEDKRKYLPPGGNITNEFLGNYYPNWKITIRDIFKRCCNNDLMYDINPSGENGAKAIAQVPMSSRFFYGVSLSMPQDNTTFTEVYSRINPFLMHDIGMLLRNPGTNSLYSRSNYAYNSEYFNENTQALVPHNPTLNYNYYTDQQDVAIILEVFTEIIPTPSPPLPKRPSYRRSSCQCIRQRRRINKS